MDAVQQDTFATLGLAEEGEGEDRRALRAERGGDGGVGSAHQRFQTEAPYTTFRDTTPLHRAAELCVLMRRPLGQGRGQ